MGVSKIFIAGSGGQGILLMGQMLAYAAMLEDKAATFLPSYGPEMRGGLANCTVVISDKPISCPLIFEADLVVAMNMPSKVKFTPLVKKGGILLFNSSFEEDGERRDDIKTVGLPVNDIALEMGNPKIANMIMLGEVIRNYPVVEASSIEQVIDKVFTGRKAALVPLNKKAFHGEFK